MLHLGTIRAATDGLAAAAILGEGWSEALGRFAHASGARHAVLMRNTPHRPVAAISNLESGEAVVEHLSGQAPPNSRYQRIRLEPAMGFRVDHDDYTDDLLARDPYYQEFLRRHGVFWHANVRITSGHDEFVELSLKRGIQAGPYQREDAALLDRVLPELEAVARIARVVLDAEVRGMSRILRRHGGPVLEIDGRGRLMPGQDLDAGPAPLRAVGRRIVSLDAAGQKGIDRAIARATERPGRLGLAPLQAADGRRYLFQVQPVPGHAREIFLSASALAVVVEQTPPPDRIIVDPGVLRDAFGLTVREAEVASLVARGFDLASAARVLGIRPDTARTYLKDAFGKTGTHRQAELVMLFARLDG